MITEVHLKIRVRFARILCGGILCGIFIAGLWPFHAPANQVNWSPEENRLSFGRYGTVLSAGTFQSGGPSADASESLEIWLAPQNVDGNQTILAFDSTDHAGSPLTLIQTGDTFRIQQHNVDPNNISWTADSAVQNVFRANTRVFITILLSTHQTSVYVNGVLSKVFPILGASTRNLTGRLVVSNSPVIADSWTGAIFGLAIYHTQLTALQVAKHYREWTAEHRPDLADGVSPVALYLFNEHDGRIAHNLVDAVTDLQLPARYFVLHPRFLNPVWRPYRFGLPGWSYWEDVLVNVGGFVPVGFCLLDYLLLMRPVRHPAALILLAGFAVSLTIECLQWFLPTRDSDMTDVMTNTLGTGLGVALRLSPRVRELWDKICNSIAASWEKAFSPINSFEKTRQD
jgi:hypothetical protein